MPLLLLFLFLFSFHADAQEISQPVDSAAIESTIQLGLPLQCQVGKSCWVMNYVDEDSTSDRRDYACGKITYDGHDGTDFAIRDLAVMNQGVPVLAAASGEVLRTRNNAEDGLFWKDKTSIKTDAYCGNGVVIKHDENWETQYCHMKKGSVVVRSGQHVKAGEKIGEVGLSGATEYPHVHLGVRYQGKPMDPFVGFDLKPTCANPNTVPSGPLPGSLWSYNAGQELYYQPFSLFHAGFAGEIPVQEKAQSGDYDNKSIRADSQTLSLWADFFGLRPNDVLVLLVQDPLGRVVMQSQKTVQGFKSRYYAYIGRKSAGKWLVGQYTGTITLQRQGMPIKTWIIEGIVQ